MLPDFLGTIPDLSWPQAFVAAAVLATICFVVWMLFGDDQ